MARRKRIKAHWTELCITALPPRRRACLVNDDGCRLGTIEEEPDGNWKILSQGALIGLALESEGAAKRAIEKQTGYEPDEVSEDEICALCTSFRYCYSAPYEVTDGYYSAACGMFVRETSSQAIIGRALHYEELSGKGGERV